LWSGKRSRSVRNLLDVEITKDFANAEDASFGAEGWPEIHLDMPVKLQSQHHCSHKENTHLAAKISHKKTTFSIL
jgi:hypothetical protein